MRFGTTCCSVAETGRITVCPVEEVGLARWFEVGTPPLDPLLAHRRLLAALGHGDMRLVALRRGTVVGRLAARRDAAGRLSVGSPICGQRPVAISLLEACDAHARADGGFRYLESKPSDDAPNVEQWLDFLTGGGFQEVAVSHVYEAQKSTRPFSGAQKSTRPFSGIDVESLRRLYIEFQEQTLDRVDSHACTDISASFDELTQHGFDPDLWPVVWRADQAVGFVASSLHGGDVGWILFIGVAPAERRKGLATAMLQSALAVLEARGAQYVRALIDDHNEASIRLHRAQGLAPLVDRYMTWRKVL